MVVPAICDTCFQLQCNAEPDSGGLDPAIRASQGDAVPVSVDARLKAGHDD